MRLTLAPGKVAYIPVFLQDAPGSATGRSVLYRISHTGSVKILDYECEAVIEGREITGFANTALRKNTLSGTAAA